jgi:Sulfotransferase family
MRRGLVAGIAGPYQALCGAKHRCSGVCKTHAAMASTTPQGQSRSRRPKVIYVMGAGRSGSTILGVTLGNCADMFFAGELDKWLPRGGVPKREDPRRTAFWQQVRASVANPDAIRAAHPQRYLERSSSLFRLRRRRVRRRLGTPYRRAMGELYDAVSSTAGASYVVDTSHYPLRAHELQPLQGIELHLLLLVRDPREVVASFARDDVVERRFSPFTTSAYLLLTYLLSTWVFLKHPRDRRVVLFYEDLLADPEGVLRALLDRLGSNAELPDFTSLETGIPLHGNRLVDSPLVSLHRREAPADGSSRGGRLFAAMLTKGLSALRPRISARVHDRRSASHAASGPR